MKKLMTTLGLLIMSLITIAQPQFSTTSTTPVSSTTPFASIPSNTAQWLYTPSELNMPSATLNKIYIKVPTPVNLTSQLYTYTIKMGHTTGTTLSTYNTGLTQVFSGSFMGATSVTGDWIPIVFQVNFPYDNSQNLIVEVTTNIYGNPGYSVVKDASIVNKGLIGNATTSAPDSRVQIGFDTAVVQDPQYGYFMPGGGAYNNIPFNSSTNVRQCLYHDVDLNMPSGMITRIYFKSYLAAAPSYGWVEIKMGPTTLSQYTTCSYITGLTSVYSAPYSSITTSNNWLVFDLPTPYYYDSTQNLVVEATALGMSTGFQMMGGLETNRSILGYVNQCTNIQSRLYALGFDQTAPLPVQSILSAKALPHSVKLEWTNGHPIGHYTVERSTGGGAFYTIATTNSTKYTDIYTGTANYRIAYNNTYSNTITVTTCGNSLKVKCDPIIITRDIYGRIVPNDLSNLPAGVYIITKDNVVEKVFHQ